MVSTFVLLMKSKGDADFLKQSYIKTELNDLQDFEPFRMSVAESNDVTKEGLCSSKDPAEIVKN